MIKLEKVQAADRLPSIQEAMAYNPFLSANDVEQLSRDSSIEVFAILNNGHEVGCVVVDYLENAQKVKHLNIVGIECRIGAYNDRREILTRIEELAKDRKCLRLLASGREGWLKLANELGYSTMKQIVFWKTLE